MKNQKICHHRQGAWERGYPCWAGSFFSLVGTDILHTPTPPHTHTKKIQGHVCNPHMGLRSALHVPSDPAHASCWHCKECLTCCGKTSFSSCFNICSLMPWIKVSTKYHLLWENTKTSTFGVFPLGGKKVEVKRSQMLKKNIYL